MQIPRSFIDDLLANTDIVDVLSSKLSLKKAGKEYHACCPFHHEKTPSFTISQTKQFYHCFGCGAHGNVISFLMEYDKLEFVETIEYLASLQNLSVPYVTPENKSISINNNSAKQTQYELMAQISDFYQEQLALNIPAMTYLKQRQISDASIKYFCIGYAPDSFNSVINKFSKNKKQQQILDDIGMLSSSDQGHKYDKFRHRIMFPILNKRGKTIGFGGRVLDDAKPKYLNSPETNLFHKGREVYGLYQIIKNAVEFKQLLVVEGYMDVVSLFEHGINNAVATLGTATTQDQLALIFKSTDNIVFCYDGDRAGKEAAVRVLDNVLPLMHDGRQVKFVFLPDGEDPDSYIANHGLVAFQQFLTTAESLSDFLFKTNLAHVDLSTNEGKAKLTELVVPKIEQIPGATLKIYLKNMLGNKLGIVEPSRIEEIFNSYTKNQTKNQTKNKNDEIKAEAKTQAKQKNKQILKKTPMRVIIALLLQNPHLISLVPNIDVIKSAEIAGFNILYDLVQLCKTHIDANTGQLIEFWRDKPEFHIIQKLASWENFTEETQIEAEFCEKLDFLYNDLINRQIEKLIEKDRKNLLSNQEKEDLSKLLVQQKLGRT